MKRKGTALSKRKERKNCPLRVLSKEESDTGEPHVIWDEGRAYPVIELGRRGASTPLPGTPRLIDQQDLKDSKDVLVLSERSGGSRSLLEWWKSQLDDLGESWVTIKANAWDSVFFEWSKSLGGGSNQPDEKILEARKAIAEALEGVGSKKSAVGRAKVLHEWAGTLTESFTLIIRDLHSAGSEIALEVATAFRTIRDFQKTPTLRVVLISHSEVGLGDLWDRSGYLPLLCQWRVAGLDGREIKKLLSARLQGLGKVSRIESRVVDAIHEEVGGQPLLLQQLCNILEEHILRGRPKRQPGLSIDDVADAAIILRENAPDPCRVWGVELEKLLKQEPELIPALKSYVVGNSIGEKSFPLPKEERPLFVAGWLGLDRLGRWGIRSAFHAHLARPILDAAAASSSRRNDA